MHVVSLAAGREIVARCGQTFEIPSGDAEGWIESSAQVSPSTVDVSDGGDFTVPAAVPSGRVLVTAPSALRSGEHAALFGLAPPPEAPLFERPILGGGLAHPHLVPAGNVVAVLFDAKGNALAISKPHPVAASKQTTVESTRTAGDLLVILERPGSESKEPVGLTAMVGDARRPPDVFVVGSDRILAIWYGVDARAVRLVLDSKTVRLPVEAVDVARLRITTVRAKLQPLPTLTVAIGDLPPSVKREDLPPLYLTVLGDRGDTSIRPRIEATAGKTYTFEHLPPIRALVMLEIGPFKTGGRVDLTSGNDVHLDLALEPVPISGTVYAGESAARAELRFLQKGEPVRVETDERGRYNVTLWEERRYFVDILLLDQPAIPPSQEVVAVAANQTIDFRIPAMHFAARIHDAEDGEPVGHATVAVRNSWTAEDGPHNSVRAFPSDGETLTQLPPQKAGRSEVRVTAPGYLEVGPLIVEIQPDMRESIVDVPMHRIGETRVIELRSPDGSAAAGAELAVSADASQIVWRGTADTAGRIDLPKSFATMLLLTRHPSAASTVFRLDQDATRPFVDHLRAPGTALTIIAKPRDASRAARAVVASIDGIRLTGAALGFLTWSSSLTDREYQWVARNLPPQPLHVIVVAPPKVGQALAGTFDAVATVLPYPWPTGATVQPID
ncbi:MAG: hypothetical protein DMF56_25720 [Acidobacteria bacterium]|nr:MAG: hypothetical protein DMF56_25720 [Acidobacteriota bacterium]